MGFAKKLHRLFNTLKKYRSDISSNISKGDVKCYRKKQTLLGCSVSVFGKG